MNDPLENYKDVLDDYLAPLPTNLDNSTGTRTNESKGHKLIRVSGDLYAKLQLLQMAFLLSKKGKASMSSILEKILASGLQGLDDEVILFYKKLNHLC